MKKKTTNWRKAVKSSKELESKKDALRVVELIRELYNIVIIKHGKK